jgi:hypothetical protein
MKHEINIEPTASTMWRRAGGGKPARAVRWRCSCGKAGPDVLERERQRAERGGAQHLRNERPSAAKGRP